MNILRTVVKILIENVYRCSLASLQDALGNSGRATQGFASLHPGLYAWAAPRHKKKLSDTTTSRLTSFAEDTSKMKPIANYPIWLSMCMLIGPFLMIGGIVFRSQQLIWTCEIVGAVMVMIALFYLSKRLHEQMEEIAAIRQRINLSNPDHRES